MCNFNNSAYKVFYENIIKRALNDPSQTVGPTTIKFYREDPSSLRPDSLTLKEYRLNAYERFLVRNFPGRTKKIAARVLTDEKRLQKKIDRETD